MGSTERNGAESTAGVAEPPVSVLGRAALLLRAFDDRSPALGVGELSRQTGLAKSTVHRMCAELCSVGLLEKEAGGYRLGDWLFELGELVPTRRTLSEAAQPIMEDLREATHQRIHLAVLDGVEVVYVNILGGSAMGLASRVGGRLPAHSTGVGKVMLAYSPKAVVTARIAAGLPQLTPRTIGTAEELVLELRRIRSVGTAFDVEESHLGVSCVAAPVFGADRKILAGLSVTGRTGSLDPVTLGPAVRIAAFTLSRTLRMAGI
jgi:DNA-binding IclR family transcriptional regulator